MAAWSRKRKERADALALLGAQLEARAERLCVLESQLTSREAEIEETRRRLQTWDEKLAIESN